MTGLAIGLIVMSLGIPMSDLADDLEPSDDIDFGARQLVVTWTEDGVLADVGEIVHVEGMAMASNVSDTFLLGDGKAIRRNASGLRYLEAPTSTPWRLYDGYTVVDGAPDPRLTNTRVVEIMEGGILRARFLIDSGLDLPVVTEIFGADAELYRYSALLSIEPGLPSGYSLPDMETMPAPDVMEEAEAATLPSNAGHYWQADSYAAPHGIQAFFTDGLFSFSVFELSRRVGPGEMEAAATFELGGRKYLRVFSPSAVSVFWRAPDHHYLLIGDLPPDHLETVLAELPAPGRPNLAKRLWRGLFG